jgi:hypothetical protein
MIKKTITKIVICPKCGTTVKCEGVAGERISITCSNCKTKGYFQFKKVQNQKTDKKIKQYSVLLSYFIVMIPIFISNFLFSDESLGIFLSFILLIPIFVILNFNGKIPLIYALIMLIISAFSLAFYKNASYANQFTVYAYWLLVVGIICQLIEYLKKQRHLKERKLSI